MDQRSAIHIASQLEAVEGRSPAATPAVIQLVCSQMDERFDEPVLRHVFDGLPEQIAIVDADWTILLVNRSWAGTASKYRPFLEPGQSYAAFLAAHAADGITDAAIVLRALEDMSAGRRTSFSHVYRGSGLWSGRHHRVVITRCTQGDRTLAVVTRYDVTELVELKQQREQLGDALLHIQADERKRIGRELHDAASQSLVALHLQVGRLRQLRSGGAAGKLFDEIDETVEQLHKEIRTISYLAHPPSLEALGFSDAITALVHGFARRAGLSLRWELEGDLAGIPDQVSATLYRLTQEALTNIYKHARASACAVRLRVMRGAIQLAIEDDGVGAPWRTPREPSQLGVGVAGMRMRVVDLGGRFSIRSGKTGTRIAASIPLVQGAAARSFAGPPPLRAA